MSYENMTKEQLIQEIITCRTKLAERVEHEFNANVYQKRYYELIQESRDGFAMLDHHGKFVICNPVYNVILGYGSKELRSKTYREITPEEYHILDQKQFDKMFERGFSDLYEKEYIGKAGNRIPIEIRSYLIKDEKGNFSGTWSYIRDVSERKQAAISLRESEKRLIAAQRIAKIGDFTWEIGTGEVTWSDALFDLLQYDKSEKIDYTRVNLEIHHPDDLEGVTKWLNDCIASGKSELTPNEYRIIRKDGEILHVRTEGIIERREGVSPKAFATIQDISDRKRAEAEHERLQTQLHMAQKMESVGRLAGGVAHDFNNMLSVIIGHAELAMRQADPSLPIYDGLKEILKAAQRSADLTRQLLAFARKQAIAPKILNLNDTVTGMLKMLRRLIGEDIDLVWTPGVDLWPVKIDPIQIDQIMANLCINARDSINGVGKVTIETRNIMIDADYCADHLEVIPGTYVMLVVSDNGCGMDKETLKNVFEPFFTTKMIGEGTGLGLSTVYGIVKQNKGFINAYSEPGQGAAFKIYIPSTQELKEETSKPVTKVFAKGSETVLLVEDEKSILKLGKTALEQCGYIVLTASTPSEALSMAQQYEDPIHILVTDVVMPEMNGKELKGHIERIRPSIKVLFTSGYTANIIFHQGILEEDLHFLPKPFSVKSLAGKVREILDQQV